MMVFMEVLIHRLVGSLDGGPRPPEGPAHQTGHQLAMIDCMLRPFRPRSTLDQDIICNFAHPIFWLVMFLIENTFKSKGHHLYVTENINISKVGSQALKCSIKVNDLKIWKNDLDNEYLMTNYWCPETQVSSQLGRNQEYEGASEMISLLLNIFWQIGWLTK